MSPPVQIPSLCRMVIYHAPDHCTPQAAVIVGIYDRPTFIDVYVFPNIRTPTGFTWRAVPFFGHDEEQTVTAEQRGTRGWCTWPPRP